MGKIISIARFEVKRLFQNRRAFLLLFGMPLLFTFIFGGVITGDGEYKPEIAVVDEDQTEASHALINELKASDSFTFTKGNSKRAAEQFDNQEITGYIIVGKGFESKLQNEEAPEVVFVSGPSFEGAALVEQLINDSLVKQKVSATAAKFYRETTGENPAAIQEKISDKLKSVPAAVETVSVTKNEDMQSMNNLTARSAGFTIMFVMIAMLSSTGILLEARQNGVWYRMMSTPATKVELLCGYMLAFFVIGWIQFGILMTLSEKIFHIEWGNPFANMILVSSLLLCSIGLGLFLAGFVKTSEQQSVFGNLIIISTCMIAGVYWPVEIMPDFIQHISTFLPQYWGMEGFAELTVRGGGIGDILTPVGILLGFAVMFLMVGLRRVRFE
ncbi:ABC transporter permease [Bacillus sp. es.034]|uniref:ABC transporter permease n=1 Tax=Bacillus sp. es.034 TaxID=1761763 RepID=UPI000BF65355|nr:ABC transporter permease [Bacillus sp. es.034]PFG05159.1 ABC-2 type transport system permease protein [Bacillus sp. es.034]